MPSPHISDTVLNRSPPEYDWKGEGKQDQVHDYEGEIYQPPPLIKHAFNFVRYHLAPRAQYDENQRRFVLPEVDEAQRDLTWAESFRKATSFNVGVPKVQRPFPWKDQYERSGFCPEEFEARDWRFPRRTMMFKYIPPPKDGVFEDQAHVKEYAAWAVREFHIYRSEMGLVKHTMTACHRKNIDGYNYACRDLMDLYMNMQAKTNVDKVKMLLWSGVPAIKDGGFKVRY
eukprot:TRINITY_DN1810_c0_g1_i1.p2 TRINITY_DN1810_c0_g1~~TRINITY_DN1810_c0_g1_i1.p2  ORF type:complete len:229 (+),score=90.65 TRINITY_DN1810_c0_g1_i1:64-750(+)